MIKVFISIFNVSVLLLIAISLWPGSLIGYFLYNDFSIEPDLIPNPFGTTINHFVYYLYVSILGFFIYRNNKNFNKLAFGMFFLAAILELLHLIVPNRSFQLSDLISNILGVIVAYCVIKIYLFFKKQ